MPENASSEKLAGLSEGKLKRLKNLKPYPKGVSGNPGGKAHKPKALLSEALRDRLAMAYDELRTKAEAAADRIIKEAIDGEAPVPAFVAARDTTEGRPMQAVKIDANLSQPSDDRLAEIIAAAATRAAANPSASDA